MCSNYTNIAAIQNAQGVVKQIWLYGIIGVMLLMCRNTTTRVYGAWIETYYVSCVKTYSSFGIVS